MTAGLLAMTAMSLNAQTPAETLSDLSLLRNYASNADYERWIEVRDFPLPAYAAVLEAEDFSETGTIQWSEQRLALLLDELGADYSGYIGILWEEALAVLSDTENADFQIVMQEMETLLIRVKTSIPGAKVGIGNFPTLDYWAAERSVREGVLLGSWGVIGEVDARGVAVPDAPAVTPSSFQMLGEGELIFFDPSIGFLRGTISDYNNDVLTLVITVPVNNPDGTFSPPIRSGRTLRLENGLLVEDVDGRRIGYQRLDNLDAVEDSIAQLLPLIDASDAFYPVAFDQYSDEQAFQRDQAVFQHYIRYALTVAAGKPVLPVISHRYDGDEFEGDQTFRLIPKREHKDHIRYINNSVVNQQSVSGIVFWDTDDQAATELYATDSEGNFLLTDEQNIRRRSILEDECSTFSSMQECFSQNKKDSLKFYVQTLLE